MSLAWRVAPKNDKCSLPRVSQEYVDIMRIHCKITEPEKSLSFLQESQKVENDSIVQMLFKKRLCKHITAQS